MFILRNECVTVQQVSFEVFLAYLINQSTHVIEFKWISPSIALKRNNRNPCFVLFSYTYLWYPSPPLFVLKISQQLQLQLVLHLRSVIYSVGNLTLLRIFLIM